MLSFTKMNGAGNDFIVFDNRQQTLDFSTATIARFCDRHRGVGADGLLLVEPFAGEADYRMRYYNADGGEAEMCGNGARCFARFVNRLHEDTLENLSFETMAGTISATFSGENVTIGLSEPRELEKNAALDVDGESLIVHSFNTGVPHAVVMVDDVDAVDIRKIGAGLRFHEHFAPAGTNVNAASVTAPGHLRIRTYERGVEDETLACGTGMVACALIHHQLTGQEGPVSVTVKGGDTLQIGFSADGDTYKNVTLSGPADFVFNGTLEDPPSA